MKEMIMQTHYHIFDSDFKRNFVLADELLHGVTCDIKEQSS